MLEDQYINLIQSREEIENAAHEVSVGLYAETHAGELVTMLTPRLMRLGTSMLQKTLSESRLDRIMNVTFENSKRIFSKIYQSFVASTDDFEMNINNFRIFDEQLIAQYRNTDPLENEQFTPPRQLSEAIELGDLALPSVQARTDRQYVIELISLANIYNKLVEIKINYFRSLKFHIRSILNRDLICPGSREFNELNVEKIHYCEKLDIYTRDIQMIKEKISKIEEQISRLVPNIIRGNFEENNNIIISNLDNRERYLKRPDPQVDYLNRIANGFFAMARDIKDRSIPQLEAAKRLHESNISNINIFDQDKRRVPQIIINEKKNIASLDQQIQLAKYKARQLAHQRRIVSEHELLIAHRELENDYNNLAFYAEAYKFNTFLLQKLQKEMDLHREGEVNFSRFNFSAKIKKILIKEINKQTKTTILDFIDSLVHAGPEYVPPTLSGLRRKIM